MNSFEQLVEERLALLKAAGVLEEYSPRNVPKPVASVYERDLHAVRTEHGVLLPLVLIPTRMKLLLLTVDDDGGVREVCEWQAEERVLNTAYWLMNIEIVCRQEQAMDFNRTQLPVHFYESVAVVAQYPEIGSCRSMRNPLCLCQAYRHPDYGRVVIDNRSYDGNHWHNTGVLLKEGGGRFGMEYISSRYEKRSFQPSQAA